MKQEMINRAWRSLTKLSGFDLPVKKAYSVYKLMKALEVPYQFAVSEEQKYLAEFHGTVMDDGTISFQTPMECASFRDKVEELHGAEVDVEFESIALSEDEFGNQTLTPADILNLEGFISFE